MMDCFDIVQIIILILNIYFYFIVDFTVTMAEKYLNIEKEYHFISTVLCYMLNTVFIILSYCVRIYFRKKDMEDMGKIIDKKIHEGIMNVQQNNNPNVFDFQSMVK